MKGDLNLVTMYVSSVINGNRYLRQTPNEISTPVKTIEQRTAIVVLLDKFHGFHRVLSFDCGSKIGLG
jgi:hypothetical protein